LSGRPIVALSGSQHDIPQLLPFPSPWPGKTVAAASAAAGKESSGEGFKLETSSSR
jgi:hypothetical protein